MRERKPIDAALRGFLDAQAAAAVAPAPNSNEELVRGYASQFPRPSGDGGAVPSV